jgi:peptidoglycan/xylan/chitin deacetylase (PgdA/CDA1 family)
VTPSHTDANGMPASPSKRLWLTFDDGPSAKYTPPILGILRHHQIKATFFVVGSMLTKGAMVVEQIEKDGHSIGNHSYSHPDLTGLTDDQIAMEIVRTEEAIVRHATPQKIFRPPYGRHNARVSGIAARLGYQMILWDVNPWNLGSPVPGWIWPRYGTYLVQRRSSSCVLLHDIHAATARHLDRFLRNLKSMDGLTFEPPVSLLRYASRGSSLPAEFVR